MNITNPWPWGACECLDNVNVSTLKLSPSLLTTGLLLLKPELQTPIFTALKLRSRLLLCIPSVLAPGFHNSHCATSCTQNKITHTQEGEREGAWYIGTEWVGVVACFHFVGRLQGNLTSATMWLHHEIMNGSWDMRTTSACIEREPLRYIYPEPTLNLKLTLGMYPNHTFGGVTEIKTHVGHMYFLGSVKKQWWRIIKWVFGIMMICHPSVYSKARHRNFKSFSSSLLSLWIEGFKVSKWNKGHERGGDLHGAMER